MLNPSTATEVQNDPTIERCERRARALGYSGFQAVNLYALRATDPRKLREVADSLGPWNDEALAQGAAWADHILCAWGGHGDLHRRGAAVCARLRTSGKPLMHLGLTQAGQPKHPLYIGYQIQPQLWA